MGGSLASEYSGLVNILKKYIDENKIHSLLKLLKEHSLNGNFIAKENYLNYFLALAHITDEIPHKKDSFESEISMVTKIIEFLLDKNNKDDNYHIISSFIEKSDNFSICCTLLKNQNYYSEKGDISSVIFSKDNLSKLNKQFIKRIKDSIELVENNKYYRHMMFFWNKHEKNSFENYAKEKVQTADALLNTLDKMLYQKDIDLVSLDRIDYQVFALFINLEQAKERIDQVKNNNSTLYINHKKSIELFLKDFDKRNDELY